MSHGPVHFATTRWSVVLAAGQGDDPAAAQSLDRLCRTYWYPLYAYLRRRGYGAHDAEDLIQGFFERFLHDDSLRRVDQARGRFRSFLLMALNRFVCDVWDRDRAFKRGGGERFVSLDDPEGETRYQQEPATNETPERIYERRWALAALEQAITRLQADFTSAGKQRQFDELKAFLASNSGAAGYAEVATHLGMTTGAVAVAVHRLRQRYRELVRDEIAQTLTGLEDLDQEMRQLFSTAHL